MSKKVIEQNVIDMNITLFEYNSGNRKSTAINQRSTNVYVYSDKCTELAKAIDPEYQKVEDERDELKVRLKQYETTPQCKLFTSKTPNGNCDFCGKSWTLHFKP